LTKLFAIFIEDIEIIKKNHCINAQFGQEGTVRRADIRGDEKYVDRDDNTTTNETASPEYHFFKGFGQHKKGNSNAVVNNIWCGTIYRIHVYGTTNRKNECNKVEDTHHFQYGNDINGHEK